MKQESTGEEPEGLQRPSTESLPIINFSKANASGSQLEPHKHHSPFEFQTPMNIDLSKIQRDALKAKHVRAYAVGHLSNDLCAAAWFTYVLYYLQEVIKLG